MSCYTLYLSCKITRCLLSWSHASFSILNFSIYGYIHDIYSTVASLLSCKPYTYTSTSTPSALSSTVPVSLVVTSTHFSLSQILFLSLLISSILLYISTNYLINSSLSLYIMHHPGGISSKTSMVLEGYLVAHWTTSSHYLGYEAQKCVGPIQSSSILWRNNPFFLLSSSLHPKNCHL